MFAGALAVAVPARAQMPESELVMRINRLENQVRKLFFELLVAVLQLLVRSSELAHLVFEPVDPHHEFGFRHLRARRQRNCKSAREHHRHKDANLKSSHDMRQNTNRCV